MRQAFIQTLHTLAKSDRRIMLLTGDLGFTVFEPFRDAYPDRFINVGVAEQNMMGLAAGLALTGKVVFAYSIATFATMRPFEQIRTDIAVHKLPVVVVGTGAGLSYGDALPTHHALEDIALMRSVPGMTVLCPADPVETAWATRQAVRLHAPVYLRLGKRGEPTLYGKTQTFTLGKGSVLKNGRDVAIIASGNIVSQVLEAAATLEKKRVSATVVSMHTIKPIDRELLVSLAQKYPLVITVEEHTVVGGLGGAVAEVLAEIPGKARLVRIGIEDRFVSHIGSHAHLRGIMQLTPKHIAARIYKEFRKI